MKYFTDELWSKFNSDSKDERSEAELEWEKNNKEYSIIFEAIKNRFSKKFLKTYLNNYGFHDFHIKEFQIVHKEYKCKNPISINLIITDEINIWKITYKYVRKISVNYQEEIMQQNDWWNGRVGFDDWGYDEFLPIDEQTLSHEILFASGSTILVHFKKGNIFINKV